jgi:hypothetical protein
MTKKIYRFIKESIKSMDWHSSIEITDTDYVFWEGHIRKSDYQICREKSYKLSKEDAEKYISENQKDLIEVYEP